MSREAVRGEYERRSENIDISQGTLSTVDDYNYSLHFPRYVSPVCERNDRWPRILQKAISLEPRPDINDDSYTDVKNCASFKETCYL